MRGWLFNRYLSKLDKRVCVLSDVVCGLFIFGDVCWCLFIGGVEWLLLIFIACVWAVRSHKETDKSTWSS